MTTNRVLCISALIVTLGLQAAAVVPLPEYYPTCGNAQNIAPMQVAGGAGIRARTDVVWNGKDYGAAWVDGADNHLYFRRFYADGTPVAAAAMLSSRASDSASPPDMVWNGSGYAIVWAALNTTKNCIYMVRLDANGVLIGGSEALVGYNGTQDSASPSLAWSGSSYCCAYTYKLTPYVDHDIYAVLINSSGVVTSSPVVSLANNIQDYPSVAWNPGLGYFAIAWDDNRSGTQYVIYGNNLSPAGSFWGEVALITPPATKWARVPSLAAPPGNNFIGMAYYDTRNTYGEVYFARFDKYLAKIGSEARLIPEATWNAYNPRLAWTGAEFGVVFEDFRGGNRDIWYQAITATGTANGTSKQVTFSSGLYSPSLAFGRNSWLLTASDWVAPNYVEPLGCSYPYAPPCPESAIAYNVSGTQATLAWLPSPDPYTDIAYYQIYRNDALVGITDNTVYTDTGLSLSTNYTYAIRAVNAGQAVSTGCTSTSSVYLKTSASLVLMVNKSASNTDAALSWTDAGLAGYNVFRGTSPQVMSLIGTSNTLNTSDPGVLTDTVLYFYTVDDPGQ